MNRKHFYESMIRENDYFEEYIKIEKLLAEIHYTGNSEVTSVNSWISYNFRKWPHRGNYISFDELREQLGYPKPEVDLYGNLTPALYIMDVNEYFLFCEMIINLVFDLEKYRLNALDDVLKVLIETIKVTASKVGFEIKRIGEEIMIVESNAAAIEVADKNPNLADIVIEFNHYLLKGDIKRKREILKVIADEMEPKRKALKETCAGISEDFFFLANNINIRHNNSDPMDKAHYNPFFSNLTDDKKEEWYDLAYEQALTVYIMREQVGRTKQVKELKQKMNTKE